MGKYSTTFKTSIQAALAYRGEMTLWVITSFFYTAILPFVWLSVYGEQNSISGFSKPMMVTYFILIPIIETLTASWVDFVMRDDIKEGKINGFLIRPINYLYKAFWAENGWKASRPFVSIVILLILYPFLHNFFYLTFHPGLLLLIPVLIMSRILCFVITSIIGMAAFWTTRSNWATQVWWALQTIAAGYVAPLAFFPSYIQKIISFTPFPMTLQVPINVILDTISTQHIIFELMKAVIWIVILAIIAQLLWKKGVKKTEGIGM